MELLLVIAPFWIFLVIVLKGWQKYKNKSIKEKESKPSKYPYLELLFYTKSSYRKPETNIYNRIFQFAFLIGLIFIYLSMSRTVIPLDKMYQEEGKIVKVEVGRKGPSTYHLLTEDGTIKFFSLTAGKKTQLRLINTNVKFWYVKSNNSMSTPNEVFQVYQNNKPFYIKDDKYWVYDKQSHLKQKNIFMTIGAILLCIGLLSLLILWILNRKDFERNKLNA